MIIWSRSNRCSQYVSIIMDRFYCIYKESKEHQVCLWRFARSQQVHPGISSHTPIIMFATSIDSGKWFFMKQYSQVVTACDAVHYIHQQSIVIDGNINFLKNWST